MKIINNCEPDIPTVFFTVGGVYILRNGDGTEPFMCVNVESAYQPEGKQDLKLVSLVTGQRFGAYLPRPKEWKEVDAALTITNKA